ncbi:MAG: cyclodeaminase/cyclohydrolase family protein [Bacillota bacterium]
MLDVAELATRRLVAMLASSDPVPGGGCAAAVAGAQGAALVAMVARLALRRTEEEEVANRLEESARQADRLGEHLLELASQDVEAYTQVMRAYRLPKGTEEEKEARSRAIHQALIHAAQVPMESVRAGVAGLEILAEVLPLVPSSALSDAGVAGWMFRSCVEGAALNVRANWQSMRSAPPEGLRQLEDLVAQSRKLFEQLRQRLGALANGGVPPAAS